MEKILGLLTQQLKVSLVPSNATRYSAFSCLLEIEGGDHLVVMVGGDNGYGHHGLYLGYDKEKKCAEVADFGSDTGKTDNTIRIISYDKFVHGVDHVYIVPYPDDSDATRQRSIEIARYIVELKDIPQYDILLWNCETFVLMCKNGTYKLSDQIKTLFQALIDDINSKESVICDGLTAAVGISSSLSLLRKSLS
jgi:hypothetical protein